MSKLLDELRRPAGNTTIFITRKQLASNHDYQAGFNAAFDRCSAAHFALAALSGLAAAAGRVPPGWRMPGPGELPSYPDDEITAAIDVRDVLDRKVAALAAHATQVTVAPSQTEYALSNNILAPVGPVEHYRRVDAGASPAHHETDLFEGV